jgi:membrane protease YdiL (CAAX protease family)
LDFNDSTLPQELPPPPPPLPVTPVRTDENPVFDLVDVLLVVFVAVGSLLFCSFVAAGIFLAFYPSRSLDTKALASNALLIIPAQVAAYILTVGFMVFILWTRYRTALLPAVRWNMPDSKIAWQALAGGAGMAIVSQLLSAALERWIPKSLPIDQFFRTPASAYMLSAFGILVAPLVEELFFRGFLYPALARPLGMAPATAITAAGFALLHAGQLAHAWAPLLILFGVGTVLTVVRARTKSVAVCVVIHMGYNFTLFTTLFIATQGFHHMERA